jgi:hypothetical protein
VVPIYLKAAHRWVAGEDLYAPSPPLDVYRNPPGFAAAFASLTVLPGKIAGIVWRLLSATVLLGGLYRFAKATKLTPIQTGYFAALVAVLAIPSVNNGQVNVLLIGSVLLGFALAMEGKLWPAALWLALATGLKIYPVAAALLGVITVPRVGWRYAVAVVAIFVMPFAFQSPAYVVETYGSLLEALQHDDRTYNEHLFRVPHDWTIIPRVWLDVVIPAAMTKTISVLAGVVFALIVALAKSRAVTAFLLASIWMTLFGPATEIPTYTLLGPAAAWWLVRRPSIRSFLMIAFLAAPILRAALPSSEVLPCRTAAPIAAMILLVDVLARTVRIAPSAVKGNRTVVSGAMRCFQYPERLVNISAA